MILACVSSQNEQKSKIVDTVDYCIEMANIENKYEKDYDIPNQYTGIVFH